MPAWIGFDGAAQLAQVRRTVTKNGRKTVEVVYLITSDRDADPATLAAWTRSHWEIENRLHCVRDVTYQEDKSLVRTGNAPRVMASLRSLAISVLRLDGHPNIAAANRHHARDPKRTLQLLQTHERFAVPTTTGRPDPERVPALHRANSRHTRRPDIRHITMLLCLSMARMMFSYSICGSSWNGVLGCCVRTRQGGATPGGEQALIRSRGQRVMVGPGAADKSLEGQHGCGSRLEGQAVPGVRWAVSRRRGGDGGTPRGRRTVSGSA